METSLPVARASPEARVWVWVDAAAVCNLSCAHCYTASMQAAAVMALDTFRRVVGRLAGSGLRVQRFHLNWRGEPLANRALPEMLRHLAEAAPEWPVEWHTNGTLVTPERAERLLAAHPAQRVYVSLDGGNRASFERNRGEGAWRRALAGAEALLAARPRGAGPEVGIYQLDLGVPPEEYDPRFLELARAADVHTVVKPVHTDGGPLVGLRRLPRGPCFWLGHTLAVDTSGGAHTCLLSGGSALGSLLEEPVETLLGRARALRQAVVDGGRSRVPGCAGCFKEEGAPAAEAPSAAGVPARPALAAAGA
ncbi:MAG TPA: radical SAM protein [Longimicrobium sp.]